MADLDDFFKKRDKKKKPAATKSKFSVLDTEEFAKQLETITIKSAGELNGDEAETACVGGEEAPPKELPSFGVNANENQDEEWKPFDSDENKDYSGLRINIQNWKVEDEENNYEETNDENDKKAACPWGTTQLKFNKNEESSTTAEEETSRPNKPETTQNEIASISKQEPLTNGAAAAATAAPASTGTYMTPAAKRAAAEAGAKLSGGGGLATETAAATGEKAYVPPHLRNKESASGGGSSSAIPTTSVNYRRPNKVQPNIMDTMEFPTLENTSIEAVASNDKLTNGGGDKFEMAKKGGRVDTKTNKANSIDLENKFGALENQ